MPTQAVKSNTLGGKALWILWIARWSPWAFFSTTSWDKRCPVKSSDQTQVPVRNKSGGLLSLASWAAHTSNRESYAFSVKQICLALYLQLPATLLG